MLSLNIVVAAQETQEPAKSLWEISVCRPEITEAGRQSSFRFNYYYILATDNSGGIAETKTILPSEKERRSWSYLMHDSKVVPCLRKWKLAPVTRYVVYISVGTTSDPEFLSISSKIFSIRIDL